MSSQSIFPFRILSPDGKMIVADNILISATPADFHEDPDAIDIDPAEADEPSQDSPDLLTADDSASDEDNNELDSEPEDDIDDLLAILTTLSWASFLNHEQLLSLPLQDTPLSEIDDILRLTAQYSVDDIVKHVNKLQIDEEDAITGKIVRDLIKLGLTRTAQSRGVTYTKVKNEFEATQLKNGLKIMGKGKSEKQAIDQETDNVEYRPSGVNLGSLEEMRAVQVLLDIVESA